MNQLLAALLLFGALAKLFTVSLAARASSTLYACFLLVRAYQFHRNIRVSSHIPGHRYVLTPWASILSLFMPPIPYVNAPLNPRINDAVVLRAPYEKHRSTIWSTVSAFSPRISLHIADAVSIKHIVGDRHKFPKPLELYRILSVYGENVLITEGDEWRKHRKIVGGSFTDQTNELDWQQSTAVTKAWMEGLDKRRDSKGVTVEEDMSKLCLHLALSVICSTAFGVEIPSPGHAVTEKPPPGHLHTFKETLEGAMETLFITVATPSYISWLPFSKFTEAKLYKKELDAWMNEIVDERRKAVAMGEERKDLLSALVKANDALREAEEKSLGSKEGGGVNVKSEIMDQDELVGNMFIFLIAGHETSAHTLAFALGLLALHPEEQDLLHSQIIELVPDPETEIPYSDYPLFTRALVIFHETLRLYPSVIGIPKRVTTEQDTILPCSERGPGGQTEIFVPKGTYMSLDVQSLHHDPYYWKEPERFRPDRFVQEGEWNRDAFIPFSSGARSCVGQKFATVETVCILVNLCRNYKISIPKEDLVEGEDIEQQKSRFLRNASRITLTPLNLRLAFERR